MTKAMETAAADEMKRDAPFLGVLDTMITVAPLLGILGTVTGIITAFNLLGTPASNTPAGHRRNRRGPDHHGSRAFHCHPLYHSLQLFQFRAEDAALTLRSMPRASRSSTKKLTQAQKQG